MSLTPNELQMWLEWAGIRLIAMPGGRIGPATYRVFWPDYETDKYQVLDKRSIRPVRVVPPNGKEIPLVENILLLPNLCEKDFTRRILHVRALLHPVNMRHLYPWKRVAEAVQMKESNAKYYHKIGLQEVCRKVDEQTVCSISRRLNEILADLPGL